jgi:menaquinone-9 beta-reductase
MKNRLSISLSQAGQGPWDVIVVGAGPAGAMAAYELARRSMSVLLVDKNVFPRPKVCGCCLNGQTLALLEARGLRSAISRLGAVPLRHVLLASGGHQVALPLPMGVALSREALDMSLTNAAVENGVIFLPNTHAALHTLTPSSRQVILRSNEYQTEAKAAVILAADGLAGSFSANHSRPPICARSSGCLTRSQRRRRGEPMQHRRRWLRVKREHVRNGDGSAGASPSRNRSLPFVTRESRIGAAVIIDTSPRFYQPETIYMACGKGGYVGLVRLEDGRLNIAAAFDCQALRAAGHPGRLATKILTNAGLPPVPDILQLPWKGTPRLTRHVRRLAAERLFVLGDAASFVEPFTGEGIAWALRSAIAVAPLAARAVQAWESDLEKQWTDTFHQEVERRQTICRLAAALLRHPRLMTWVVRSLGLLPSLSGPVLRYLNGRQLFRGGKFVTCQKEHGQVENLPPHLLGTGIPQ